MKVKDNKSVSSNILKEVREMIKESMEMIWIRASMFQSTKSKAKKTWTSRTLKNKEVKDVGKEVEEVMMNIEAEAVENIEEAKITEGVVEISEEEEDREVVKEAEAEVVAIEKTIKRRIMIVIHTTLLAIH